MTAPIVLSAIVGGSVSFVIALAANFYRDARRRNRSTSGSNEVWE